MRNTKKSIKKNIFENEMREGKVQTAYDFVSKMPFMKINGKRVSGLETYKGYELWWIHLDSIYENFVLPYFWEGKKINVKEEKKRIFPPIPFGLFLQFVLSILFLPIILLKRPQAMIWAGDKVSSKYRCNWRQVFIYEEMEKQNISYVEFLRNTESWRNVLRNVWQRKRPVIYSAAIIEFVKWLGGLFGKKEYKTNNYWEEVAVAYLDNIRGTIWAIEAMRFLLKLIGVKAAYISTGCSRTFHELLSCKLAGIPTVGMVHGLTFKHFNVFDFLPGFSGEKIMSVDKYGVYSKWWKDYYLKNSDAFLEEQLFVSGPMRPLVETRFQPRLNVVETEFQPQKHRVLFISEQLADPAEVMPYLLKLMESEDIKLCLKFRPYRDGFEEWLKKNNPGLLERADIFRGGMQEAIAKTDVVAGSHSTAVLEALMQQKTAVSFWTDKWGDYFEMGNADTRDFFFAENPEELVSRIRNSFNAPKEKLKHLQERFFGNPYQNGSKWAVGQIKNYLWRKIKE